jgi:hypothetical protein
MTKAKRERVPSKEPTVPQPRHSNEVIILLALFRLGGASKFVDCEDVAYLSNELAPGRFTWVKYRDQINIHTIKTRLWVAKSERGGSLVIGSDRQGWMLTREGLAVVQALETDVGNQTRYRQSPEDQWREHERARLLTTEAYQKLARTPQPDAYLVSQDEAEAFFRLNAYVVGKTRAHKIQRLLNAFGQDPEIGPVVESLAKRLLQSA